MVRHMNQLQLFGDVREAQLDGPTFLTIGNFDGVHLGHQALFRTMQELAAVHTAAAAHVGVLTFEPHPLAVLRPEKAPTLLTSPGERMELIAAMGLNLGIIQPFTQEIANLRAVEFMTLLKTHLGLNTLVVGPDFALGRGRSGDIARLRELGRELDYQLVVIDPVHWQEHSVRSSSIRALLREGEVAQAANLLGRFYSVPGQVCDGDRRGRLLGTPTANLQIPAERLLPLDGVYATRTHIRGRDGNGAEIRVFDSVTNLGVRPTVDGQQHRFETHLLDFPPPGESGDLYGQHLVVEFVARLRGERRFQGLDELKAQIQTDIQRAREALASTPAAQIPSGV
jgi:riboflavin kinase/FMN adenylyltransferase